MPLEESVRLLKYPVVSGRKIINIGWHRPLHSLGCSNTMTEWAQLYVTCSRIHRTESAHGVFVGPSAHSSLDRLPAMRAARRDVRSHTWQGVRCIPAPGELVGPWRNCKGTRGAMKPDRSRRSGRCVTDANDAGGGEACRAVDCMVRWGCGRWRSWDRDAPGQHRIGDECYSDAPRSSELWWTMRSAGSSGDWWGMWELIGFMDNWHSLSRNQESSTIIW